MTDYEHIETDEVEIVALAADALKLLRGERCGAGLQNVIHDVETLARYARELLKERDALDAAIADRYVE